MLTLGIYSTMVDNMLQGSIQRSSLSYASRIKPCAFTDMTRTSNDKQCHPVTARRAPIGSRRSNAMQNSTRCKVQYTDNEILKLDASVQPVLILA